MNSTDQDIACRLLRAALDRLENRDATLPASDAPQVMIVVFGERKTAEQNNNASSNEAIEDSRPLSLACSTHPSLARFPLAEGSDTAPGMCFMEPDRHCVNSGACEMLGH
jgi:hypothetical protein